MYGGVSVPFEDTSFDNGGKGFRCIGFTAASKIRNEYLEGTTIWLVVPQKGYAVSAKRFHALIQAMKNKNYALVVRYTYRNGTAPKVMALFPHDDSMLMYELFFKDNIVSISFPSLQSKKFTPSDEQCEFMDNFMDAMDLTGQGSSENATKKSSSELLKNLLDPGLQHIYRVIAHRAVNPNAQIPKVDADLLALITPPKQDDTSIAAERMKALFPLEPPKISNKEKFLQNLQNFDDEKVDAQSIANVNVKNDSDITKIGTIKPAEDFLYLLNRGEPFLPALAKQIQEVIVDLVIKSVVTMNDKFHQSLFTYRETAKEKAPYQYNEWVETLKDLLKEREKIELWQLIVDEGLGLITANESETSTVTSEEAAAFYKTDDFCTESNRIVPMEFDDAKDLFDEM